MLQENNHTFRDEISKHILFFTLIITVILHFIIFLVYMSNRDESKSVLFDVSNERQAIQFIEQIKKEIHKIPKPQRDQILDQMKQILIQNQDSESPFMDEIKKDK